MRLFIATIVALFSWSALAAEPTFDDSQSRFDTVLSWYNAGKEVTYDFVSGVAATGRCYLGTGDQNTPWGALLVAEERVEDGSDNGPGFEVPKVAKVVLGYEGSGATANAFDNASPEKIKAVADGRWSVWAPAVVENGTLTVPSTDKLFKGSLREYNDYIVWKLDVLADNTLNSACYFFKKVN